MNDVPHKHTTSESVANKPEDLSQSASPRIGVYVCHCGGNISDVVRVEDVVRAASEMPDVCIARDCPAMCSQMGQELIETDIREQQLDRVVVAACSPSLHETTFRATVARAGSNPYRYEHVNIREQDSWCSKSDPDGATDKATCLVAAGIAKVRHADPLEPIPIKARKHVAVIGGGISGLRVARDLARAGLSVTLLERSHWLGGHVSKWNRVYPDDTDPKPLVQRLVDEVNSDDRINVLSGTEIIAASGCVGDFNLRVRVSPAGVSATLDESALAKAIAVCPEEVPSEFDFGLSQRKALVGRNGAQHGPPAAIDWKHCTRCNKCVEAVGDQQISLSDEPDERTIQVGALVLATGFDLYEPQSGEFGYGELPNVITLAQLERLSDPQGPTAGKLERDGRPVKNVCMIHCVGSRQIEGVHKPGQDGKLNEHCSRVCCSATLRASLELRRSFPDINVFELYRDIRSYGRGQENIYEAASRSGVVFIRYPDDEPPTVVPSESENGSSFAVRVKDTLTFGEELEVPADLVVLATGMMARPIDDLVELLKLSRSADGFLQEVHPKLRPVELAVGGIFVAGTCQAPMDIGESCAAGAAASAKVAGLLGRGEIKLDPYRARVDRDRCRGEGQCVEACQYQQAITLVDQEGEEESNRYAQINSALCTGCGMCVPVCPHGAIEVDGWRLEQFDAMVDALMNEYA